jgi:hypothetical protein
MAAKKALKNKTISHVVMKGVILAEILARNDPEISSVIPSSPSAHGAQEREE